MLAAVLALVAFPQAAGAEGPALPPNESCEQVAVVAKLSVLEDRAAANMLAEALRLRGSGRCLVDAFASDARSAVATSSMVYVVGGTAAIKESHVQNALGRSGYTRIWGHDRWQTQSEVAKAILTIADGGTPRETPSSLQPTDRANDCRNTAVLVKLEQREDRAAGNMLAEALRLRGSGRCLVDAFASDARTIASGRDVCVIGSVAAISNERVMQVGLDPSDVVRHGGADRWATQSEVTEAILDGAQCGLSSVESLQHLVIPGVVDSAAMAFENDPQDTDVSDITIKAYYCGTDTAKRDAAKTYVADLKSAFADSALNKQLEYHSHKLDFEWGGHVSPSIDPSEVWTDISLRGMADMNKETYCWPAISVHAT